MGSRFKIVTLRGIPVYVSSSWIWIAAIYTYSFYFQFTHASSPLQGGAALGLALLTVGLFFGSIFIHELAHAVAARSLGMKVKGITLEFWGGRTETQAERRSPKSDFIVSAVGPGSTLMLAGLFWLVHPLFTGDLSRMIDFLAGVNLLLGVVNALPGFPLDGGNMLLAATWGATGDQAKAARITGGVGMVVGAIFGVAGFLRLTRGEPYGFLFVLLAMVIFSASRALRVRPVVRDVLANGFVRDAMGPAPAAIPAGLSLSQALDHHLRDNPDAIFPVVDDGRMVGVVSFASARAVGAQDPLRPVRDGMIPLSAIAIVSPHDRLDQAVDRLGGQPGLVLIEGAPVGVISAAEISRWFERRGAGSSAPAPTPVDRSLPPRPDV